jgi:hypothetical protein
MELLGINYEKDRISQSRDELEIIIERAKSNTKIIST